MMDWDGQDRREFKHNIPDNIIDFESMLERAASHGAKRALRDLGLDDSSASADLRDLRSILASWRLARSTAFIATIKIVSGAVVLALIAWVSHPWSMFPPGK